MKRADILPSMIILELLVTYLVDADGQGEDPVTESAETSLDASEGELREALQIRRERYPPLLHVGLRDVSGYDLYYNRPSNRFVKCLSDMGLDITKYPY